MHIDINNLSESIKLYAITLQADISITLKEGKKYSEDYQHSKFIDFQSRKEIIVRKLDEVERRQMEMLRNIPSVDHNKIESVIIDFEDKASRTNIEIEKLIDDFFSKKIKKVNLETAVGYFNIINRKEKDFDKLATDVASYRTEYEINKKFDNLYNAIEKAIDNVLKSEFNLGYNSAENSMIRINKKDEEEVKQQSRLIDSNNEDNTNERRSSKKLNESEERIEVAKIIEIQNEENIVVIDKDEEVNKKDINDVNNEQQ